VLRNSNTHSFQPNPLACSRWRACSTAHPTLTFKPCRKDLVKILYCTGTTRMLRVMHNRSLSSLISERQHKQHHDALQCNSMRDCRHSRKTPLRGTAHVRCKHSLQAYNTKLQLNARSGRRFTAIVIACKEPANSTIGCMLTAKQAQLCARWLLYIVLAYGCT
jgi:hypothetical protein